MSTIFDLVSWLGSPLVRVALAILGPVGLILGCIANPSGAVNSFICRMIDNVALFWPSTPNHLKLVSLFTSAYAPTDLLAYVVYEVFTMGLAFLSVVALVKLYKLIPFKMS